MQSLYIMYSLLLSSLFAIPAYSSPLPNGTLERRKGGGGGGRGGGGGGRGGGGGGSGGSGGGGMVVGIILGVIAALVIITILYIYWRKQQAKKLEEATLEQELMKSRSLEESNADAATADQFPQMEISPPYKEGEKPPTNSHDHSSSA